MIVIAGVVIFVAGVVWALLGGFAFHSGPNIVIGAVIGAAGLIIAAIGTRAGS